VTVTRVALDFNVSHRLVGALNELYGHNGFEFMHVSKMVPPKTEDTVWADRYKRFGGRIVISGDCRIAYRPHEAVAFVDNGFVSFFPEKDWSRLRAAARSAFLVYWWPRMAQTAQACSDGCCWRLPCVVRGGELRLKDCEPEPLVIPDQVLADARRRRPANHG
jgi:hypothetical protein